MKYFNIFGEYIDDTPKSIIENFADTQPQESESTLDRINNIIEKINLGIISSNEAEKILVEFKDMEKSKKLNSDEVNAVSELEKAFAQKVKGLNLVGNLQLGGFVKAKGYYLEDGTKMNEIKKEILAVPYDENKNIDIKGIENKNININASGNGKVNVNKLNIPKSGKLTFGDGEDNDPYHIRKIGNSDNNHLRLTLNDNNNESLQIWGNSCDGDKCKPDGGKFYHGFYSNGKAIHTNNLGVGTTDPRSRLSIHNNNRSDESKEILETGFIPTAEIKQMHSNRKSSLGGWSGPSLQFNINNGSNGGGAKWAAGTIVGSADPLNSNGGYDGGLLFYTAAGGLNKPQKLAFAVGNSDQRAYFKGNVGVGTSNPDKTNGWNKVMEVQGGPHAKSIVTTRNKGVKVGNFAHQSWGNSSGTGSIGTESNHDLRVLSNYNEKMRIKTNGRVGIGTTNPQKKLHVNGNAQVDGHLKVKSLEIGNYKVYEKDKHLLFHNKDNRSTILSLNPNGSITVKTLNGKNGSHINNTLYWCNDSNYGCKK